VSAQKDTAHAAANQRICSAFGGCISTLQPSDRGGPDLDDIKLLRCTLMFASPERDEQMARLLGRYGFELGIA
jgi:hypothetical protein